MEGAGSPIIRQGQVDAYSKHPLYTGNKFQDAEWMPETVDSTGPSIHCVFPHRYIPFHSKEALTISFWNIHIVTITTLLLWGHNYGK